MDYGSKASEYIDAFMDNIHWEIVENDGITTNSKTNFGF